MRRTQYLPASLNQVIIVMIIVIRREEEEYYSTPQIRELLQHIPWMKITSLRYEHGRTLQLFNRNKII